MPPIIEGLVLHIAKYIDGLDRCCDHRCLFCIERMEPGASSGKTPTAAMIDAVLSNLTRRFPYVTTIYIAGGEPTKRADLLDIVSSARTQVPSVSLSTHGDYPEPERVAQSLALAGLTSVCLSLHGNTAELHEWHTLVQGSFERTLATLKAFAAVGIDVRVNCVVTSRNLTYLAETVDFLDDYPDTVKELTLTHYSNHGYAYYHPELWFNVLESAEAVAKALVRSADSKMTVYFRDFPLCMDERLPKYSVSVENIGVVRWNETGGSILVPEKAPAIWLPRCFKCALQPRCPGLLKANYEGRITDQSFGK